MADVFSWAAAGVLILLFAYALVRVVSFAYFRTKFEHFRATMKELTKGDR